MAKSDSDDDYGSDSDESFIGISIDTSHSNTDVLKELSLIKTKMNQICDSKTESYNDLKMKVDLLSKSLEDPFPESEVKSEPIVLKLEKDSYDTSFILSIPPIKNIDIVTMNNLYNQDRLKALNEYGDKKEHINMLYPYHCLREHSEGFYDRSQYKFRKLIEDELDSVPVYENILFLESGLLLPELKFIDKHQNGIRTAHFYCSKYTQDKFEDMHNIYYQAFVQLLIYLQLHDINISVHIHFDLDIKSWTKYSRYFNLITCSRFGLFSKAHINIKQFLNHLLSDNGQLVVASTRSEYNKDYYVCARPCTYIRRYAYELNEQFRELDGKNILRPITNKVFDGQYGYNHTRVFHFVINWLMMAIIGFFITTMVKVANTMDDHINLNVTIILFGIATIISLLVYIGGDHIDNFYSKINDNVLFYKSEHLLLGSYGSPKYRQTD